MTDNITPILAKLELELIDAMQALEEANYDKDAAYKKATDALNRLNAVQKKIDANISGLKNLPAMRGSNWGPDRGEDAQ